MRLGNLMYINNNNTTVNDKYKWTQSLSPAAIFRTNHVSLQPSWKYGTSTCTFWLQTNCLFVKDLLLFFLHNFFVKDPSLFCHLFHFQFLNVLLQSASVLYLTLIDWRSWSQEGSPEVNTGNNRKMNVDCCWLKHYNGD